MSQQSSGPTRLARTAAKEVPHRKSDRFFAARAEAKADCEQLIVDVRRSHLHEATRVELLSAAERVQRELLAISLDTPDARNAVVDLDKQLKHLQLAEKWVVAAQRVMDRLGENGSKSVRDGVLEAQDTVMWCVRADHWNGKLTASLTVLEEVVREAEVHAARSA
ncbi:unannotated protein [freshwater metagenome]|uniref:Unannotated protein n=1 Tax=freshwater metagenome TaxID=449393 RepID=A0A6J7DG63_9ZZZZ